MASAKTRRPGQFTGWHAAGALVAFFGVVVAVNVTMARFATSTFGGIVVENSYVASQEFNRWLEQAEESEKLGWRHQLGWRPDGRLVVSLDGAPADVAITAMARHPVGRLPEVPLSFEVEGPGQYVSREELPNGRWYIRLEGRAGESLWRVEDEVQ